MLDYWRRLAADEECGGGLRVNVAYKHAGRIHSKNGFICGTTWRSLHTNLFRYSKHRNGAVCSFFSVGASSAFRRAGSAPWSPHRPPQKPKRVTSTQVLTFLLSHAFVLPGATEQHQPHSHAELRERANCLCSTDKRCSPTHTATRPGVVSLRVGRSLRRPTQLPSARCLHVSAALHSREALTNEAAEQCGGNRGLANHKHALLNKVWRRRDGGERGKWGEAAQKRHHSNYKITTSRQSALL